MCDGERGEAAAGGRHIRLRERQGARVFDKKLPLRPWIVGKVGRDWTAVG